MIEKSMSRLLPENFSKLPQDQQRKILNQRIQSRQVLVGKNKSSYHLLPENFADLSQEEQRKLLTQRIKSRPALIKEQQALVEQRRGVGRQKRLEALGLSCIGDML